jgi:hypothetical protein
MDALIARRITTGSTPAGITARSRVASHFSECYRLLDERKHKEAEDGLGKGEWRRGLMLDGIPSVIVYQTNALCARTRYVTRCGDFEAAMETPRLLLCSGAEAFGD